MRLMRAASEPDEAQVRLTERAALTDLGSVLQLCAAGQVKCSATTGRPSAASIGKVAEHLASGDFYPEDAIAAFAWPLLLTAGGLAALTGTALKPTPKGVAAMGKPSAEVIRLLWRRWLTHGPLDELSRIENIKGQRVTNVLTAVKPRRQMVAQALATCVPGEWTGIETLFTRMRRGNMSPTIARNGRALYKLYLVEPEYGSLGYSDSPSWRILECTYTRAVLFEYAATLGLIDVEYTDPAGARDDYQSNWGADSFAALSRYDGLRAIRVNPLGAYALGLVDSYQPEPVGEPTTQPLRVLPNRDIVVTGDLVAADRLLLSAYATQTADRVWTVSAETLLSALDAGRGVDDFRTFLADRTTDELPSALTTVLADAQRRAAQLTDLGTVRLIECADPAVAALIARDRRLRSWCRPIGDRHLAVSADQDLKFGKALIALGYVIPRRWSQ